MTNEPTSVSLNGGAISIDNKGTNDTQMMNLIYATCWFLEQIHSNIQLQIQVDASTATVNITVTAITNVPIANDDTI